MHLPKVTLPCDWWDQALTRPAVLLGGWGWGQHLDPSVNLLALLDTCRMMVNDQSGSDGPSAPRNRLG